MQTKSILVVDDEDTIRRSLAVELRDVGYEVTTAASGEKAVLALRQGYFDLVISDMVMEGLDGIQVLKEAKHIDPEIAVILLTGFGDMNTAIDALRLQADDYLLKPCEIDELLFRVSGALEKADLRKKIKMYEDILPVCAVCKKIRDDSDKRRGERAWVPLDVYLSRKTGVKMSHGYCPECYEKAKKEFGLSNEADDPGGV